MSETKRNRPCLMLTLSPAALAYLARRAASLGMSRSALVEALLRAAQAQDSGNAVLTHTQETP